VEAILALGLLSELLCEFRHPLHAAYVDLKWVFDSIDRSALWLTLKGVDRLGILLNLLHGLRPGTCAHVRVRESISVSFFFKFDNYFK